jgi:hypothetical protein
LNEAFEDFITKFFGLKISSIAFLLPIYIAIVCQYCNICEADSAPTYATAHILYEIFYILYFSNYHHINNVA